MSNNEGGDSEEESGEEESENDGDNDDERGANTGMPLESLDDSDRLADQDIALGPEMLGNVNEILNEPPVQSFDEVNVEERVGFDRVRAFMTELFK